MERLLKEFFHEYGLSQPEIAGYTGGEKLLNSQDTGEIAFLDVEMPGLSGIHTGERLKKRNPLDKKRLFRNMKEALYQIEMETKPVPIETKDGFVVRQAEDILYIEAVQRRTQVVAVDQVYESPLPMRDWQSLLQIGCFYQTHRSFLVNMRYVTSFSKDTVKLTSPIGQNYTAYLTKRNYSSFKSAFLLYLESTS